MDKGWAIIPGFGLGQKIRGTGKVNLIARNKISTCRNKKHSLARDATAVP